MARIGAARLAAAGSVLFAVSMLWRVALAGASPDYVRDLLPSMLIGGAGVGLALSTLIAAAATALPAHRSATASAVINSGRQIASSLGVAVLVTILGSHLITGGAVQAFDVAWSVAAALAVLAALSSLALPPPVAATAAAPVPVAAGSRAGAA
jgi:hypothetical protein